MNSKFILEGAKKSETNLDDYDLGSMFRILTQNDRSFYHETDSSTDRMEVDTIKLSYEQKLEKVQNMQAGEFGILDGQVFFIFDTNLNPEANTLCNLMEAQVTDQIIPFYTNYIVVDKVTPIYRQTLNSL